ncbi:MAG TPA: DUF1801 domain-containing protein [Chloroflexota bacterium]
MSRTNPRVDEFLARAKVWHEESEKLRAIALDCGLTEELKWYKPCYTFQDSNVAIIQGFKEFCALMFFKGALLSDPNGILVKVGENSQSASQIRFTGVKEIVELEPAIRAYINEAIEVEKSGLKVPLKETSEYAVPEELQRMMDEAPALRAAFGALTPGRQRAYLLYFSAPKQSKTRTSRIEQSMPRILDGKGLND